MTSFSLNKIAKYKVWLFYNAIRAIVKIQKKYKIKEMIII